jgi:hypothetical protein
MMEAARISETSVDICLTTRQYIPEDSELHNILIVSITLYGCETWTHSRQELEDVWRKHRLPKINGK